MRTLALLFVVLVIASCSSSDDAQNAAAPPTTAVGETTSTSIAPPSTIVVITSTTGAPATTTTTTTTPRLEPPPSTIAPIITTSTTAAPTTTTTSGGPYVAGTPEIYPGAPLPGSAGAGGSGCAPGAGQLPDGVWFGYVPTIGATSVDFDLACLYVGDIAYAKGAEDGVEVDNDYYIRNVNPTLRTVPVAASATVYEIDGSSIGFLTVPFADWPVDPAGYIACPSNWCGVWLFVNGGEVTEILEQYFP